MLPPKEIAEIRGEKDGTCCRAFGSGLASRINNCLKLTGWVDAAVLSLNPLFIFIGPLLLK
jgi:hypothetical protein